MLAAELVALKVDVLVALYTPCALATQQATREIPIVVVAGDPLGSGLVASPAHPGGNITGISLMAAELHGKCIELLHDMIPSVHRVAGIANAADPFPNKFSNSSSLPVGLLAFRLRQSRSAHPTKLMPHSRW
jgi:putative tryptophan/tyrosine transport system substrate-binding protein